MSSKRMLYDYGGRHQQGRRPLLVLFCIAMAFIVLVQQSMLFRRSDQLQRDASQLYTRPVDDLPLHSTAPPLGPDMGFLAPTEEHGPPSHEPAATTVPDGAGTDRVASLASAVPATRAATPPDDRDVSFAAGSVETVPVDTAVVDTLVSHQPDMPARKTAEMSPDEASALHNAYAAAIDHANAAAAKGRQHDWMWHLNLYLEEFGMPPLHLWERPGPVLGRLTSKPLQPVDGGPLVSVIMVACNAEDTVGYAVTSILRQTWRSLELVIVDDASVDRTWSLLTEFSKRDDRIKLVRNSVQVGPYVSRNRVLSGLAGTYVTTQDADDWALPGRLEKQVRNMVDSHGAVRGNMMYMLRLQPSGLISTSTASSFSPDGAARQAFVSAMYEVKLLREQLGYWDSVRYGADAEMIRRAQNFLGPGFAQIEAIGILLADRPNSLGKQGYRVDPGAPREPSQGWSGSNREAYRIAYDAWHASRQKDGDSLYMPFPLRARTFVAPQQMVIEVDQVCACLRGTENECDDGESVTHEEETLAA